MPLGVVVKSPGDSYALFLPAAQPDPPLSNHGIIPFGKFSNNEIMQIRYFCRILYFRIANHFITHSESDIQP
jgi:hypothetical protein